MSLYYRDGNVRQEKSLEREIFQYGLMPESWVDIGFRMLDFEQAICHVCNLKFGSNVNYSELFLDVANKGKILGFLGKMAVSRFYGFSLERLYMKKKHGYYDFYSANTRILVKTSTRFKSEVVMFGERDIISDDSGPELLIAVNMEVDTENIGLTNAWIAGWCLSTEAQKTALRAADINPKLLYLRLPSLKPPKSLLSYLELKAKIRSRNRP